MNEEFHYVIARPWEKGKPELCIYTYGSEIQHGSMDGASWLKDHAEFMTRGDRRKYYIYKVTFEKINLKKLDDEGQHSIQG